MFITRLSKKAQRRGVVLILVLGMLGLLALIGVTFAIFAGQARIGARNFMLGGSTVNSAELMDFALGQLINDTSNPQSALRGHSLMRDMYGNDATFNGYLVNAAAFQGALVATPSSSPPPGQTAAALAGTYQCITTIPVGGFPTFNFARWIVSFPSTTATVVSGGTFLVGQSFEVIYDDPSGQGASNQFRVFYLSPLPANSTLLGARGPYAPAQLQQQPGTTPVTIQSTLIGEPFASAASGIPPVPTGVAFTLDGRYLHAFNGPGMGANGAWGNFKYNGQLLGQSVFGNSGITGSPDLVGMDEDYDACDLDNWFLAIQSADGQVIIPSFHRPAIIRADPTQLGVPGTPASDWRNTLANALTGLGTWNFGGANINAYDSMARILRPRNVDGHDASTFPDLIPDPSTGKITYDVDNDGDGITDAVWLDLGYPSQRNADGVLYKPLFAFTFFGFNGRLPLNTAGNLQHRDSGTASPNNPTSFFAGNPLFAQASRLGISPSEVDITFALQNADDRNNRIAIATGNAASALPNYTQFDNSDPGQSVAFGPVNPPGTPPPSMPVTTAPGDSEQHMEVFKSDYPEISPSPTRRSP